jgi:hypothetical protein
VDHRALAGHVGSHADGPDEIRRAALQEDALPDPADRAIPALLAVRDLREGIAQVGVRVGPGVDHLDHQLVLVVQPQRLGHGKLEREVPALVLPYRYAIEPHRGEVVHRTEAQEVHDLRVGLALRLGPVKGVAVPGHPRIVPQVRTLGLPGAGNLNPAVGGSGHRVRVERPAGIHGELPFTVERHAVSHADPLLSSGRSPVKLTLGGTERDGAGVVSSVPRGRDTIRWRHGAGVGRSALLDDGIGHRYPSRCWMCVTWLTGMQQWTI